MLEDIPILCIRPLLQSVRCAGDMDGYYLNVEVENSLPCVSVDNLISRYRTNDREVIISRKHRSLIDGEGA